MTLQGLLREGQCGCFVSGLGYEAFDNLAFMTDGTPAMVHFAIDFDGDLTAVPAPVTTVAHGTYVLSSGYQGE